MSAATRTHQVKTPVGNKTKRGAELEVTPKTPRPFQISPLRCASVAAEQEDRCRSQPKSKRPLQWNSADDMRLDAFGGVLENRNDMTGAALSPICPNSIPAAVDHPLGHRKFTSVKSCTDLRHKEQSQHHQHLNNSGIENMSGENVKMTLANAKHLDAAWRDCQQDEEMHDISTENCYRNSPALGPSGKRIFLWSNPAFNQAPVQPEIFCSGTTSSGSSSSSYLQDVAGDCDAESRPSVENLKNAFKANYSSKDTVKDVSKDFRTMTKALSKMDVDENVAAARPTFENQHSLLKSPVSYRGLDGNNCMSKKVLFSRSESCADLTGAGKTGPLNGDKDIKMEEIDEEIKRLTHRLSELHVQKRQWEEELMRQELEKAKNSAAAVQSVDKTNNNTSSQPAGANRNVNFATLRSGNPRHQSQQPSQGKSSKRGTTTGSVTVSKLAELRKSVSVSRRVENTLSGDGGGSKALRRLSLSGVSSQSQNRGGSISCSTTPINRSNKQMLEAEQQQRSVTPRSAVTPSRLVSSKYSRATTPDAMRSSTLYKKRERTPSATSSPMPGQQRQHTSPSKRAATVRSGYPSRSGFVTPTKERVVNNSTPNPKTSIITSAVSPTVTSTMGASVPSTPAVSYSQNSPTVPDIASTNEMIQQIANGNMKPRLLSAAAAKSFASSSPMVVGSPKSTAALYQCLESLVEDSKHFFNRLSPARRTMLRQPPQTELASGKEISCGLPSSVATPVTLPGINTCRLANLSPRDSGCVKRARDRNPSGFFQETP